MTRFQSAFAVPSGFAVATRTAAKGATSAQEPASKASKPLKGATSRARSTVAVVAPGRAA